MKIVLMLLILMASGCGVRYFSEAEPDHIELRDLSGRCWAMFIEEAVEGGLRPVGAVIQVDCPMFQK